MQRTLWILMVLVVLLVSCVPDPNVKAIKPDLLPPTPTIPLTVAAATTSLKVTPAPTAVIEVRDLPETKVAVDQFASTFGVPKNSRQILENLKIIEISGKNGRKIRTAVTLDGYPLMVESEEGFWGAIGFKDLVPEGFLVGSGINKWTGNFDDPLYKKTFEREYNLGANDGTLAEDFYSQVPLEKLPPTGVVAKYKWKDHISIENYLQEKNLSVGLMNLFPGYLFSKDIAPEWMRQFSNDELVEWMNLHLEAIAANSPKSNIKYVSVINELYWHDPVGDYVGLDGDYIYSKLGNEFIKIAFTKAKELWPEATLIFNDDTASGGIKTNLVLNREALIEYEFVKQMVKQGAPIEAFGLQTHLQERDFIVGDPETNITEYGQQLDKYIKLFADTGLDLYITELDVNLGGLPDTMSESQKENIKARIYQEVFTVCLSNSNCKGIITWGFADASSWLNDPNYPYKPGGEGLPFDRRYVPKPAYYTIMKTLFEARISGQ